MFKPTINMPHNYAAQYHHIEIAGDGMYRRERCIDPTGGDFATGYLQHTTSIYAPFPLTITQCVKRCSEYEASLFTTKKAHETSAGPMHVAHSSTKYHWWYYV